MLLAGAQTAFSRLNEINVSTAIRRPSLESRYYSATLRSDVVPTPYKLRARYNNVYACSEVLVNAAYAAQRDTNC